MVLTGNVALESMGFPTIGFAGGRMDDWEPDLVYWGPEGEMLASKRHTEGRKNLKKPLAAARMGLIYVNPEGPNGNGDPLSAAHEIRDTFARMAMNDEETVALIAGGHTFGKAHGAHKASCLGPEPAASGIEDQGLGWKNKCGTGKGADTVTSGLEGAWSASPTQWTSQYLDNLFAFEWVKVESPAGAHQWIPKDEDAQNLVPDAHIKGKTSAPIMFTTDLSLKFDPEYRKIAKRFQENPKEFEKAFARAWFKLTHRDMGPRARYLGKEVPREVFAWQDPVPRRRHALVSAADVANLKSQVLKSGLSTSELVKAAWASASSFRATDMRGGANGARVRLAPQKDWKANDPTELDRVLSKLERIRSQFNRSSSSKISIADMIVLAGSAAVENAAKRAGYNVSVPFRAGRTDATQDMTDVESFKVLEPQGDAFRNYYNPNSDRSPTFWLIDKAAMLDLSVPEMTVLVGGMRALGANSGNSKHGIFTKTGVLSNKWFVNLLSMDTEWKKSSTPGIYEGLDRKSGALKYTATPVDLIFGSNAELRAIAEVYAADDGRGKFVRDFVRAWTKVMRLDRF